MFLRREISHLERGHAFLPGSSLVNPGCKVHLGFASLVVAVNSTMWSVLAAGSPDMADASRFQAGIHWISILFFEHKLASRSDSDEQLCERLFFFRFET